MSKSKKNKNNKKKNTTYVPSEYMMLRYQQRFPELVNSVKIEDIIGRSKTYSVKNINDCPFKVVVNKLRNPEYSSIVYKVNTFFNTMLVCSGSEIINVLYLDGRDGYANIR